MKSRSVSMSGRVSMKLYASTSVASILPSALMSSHHWCCIHFSVEVRHAIENDCRGEDCSMSSGATGLAETTMR